VDGEGSERVRHRGVRVLMSANTGGSGIPAPRVEADAVGRAVAVAGDGSARPDSAPASLLAADAAGLRARAGIAARAVPLRARDVADAVAELCDLPADTGAVFLAHTEPRRARAVAERLREIGGPPVVTDADTTAITLAAAVVTAVARAGRTPAASRVVIAGSAALPELCPLLMAVGIGDISSWNASDALAFPLHHLAGHATAVVDLIGATARSGDDQWSTVIGPDDPGYRSLPAPGLFAALVHYPNATLDLDVLRACVLALVAATPRGRPVPETDDPHLAETIASAVLRVLAQRTSASRPDVPRE
jgi:malic enzyme